MGTKIVCFEDKDGKTFFKGKLTVLPLKEEYIIKKSIELFNDSEPCIIHRTFVMKKIFLQIEEYFDKSLKEGKDEILSSNIPDDIIQMLDIKEKIYKITLK